MPYCWQYAQGVTLKIELISSWTTKLSTLNYTVFGGKSIEYLNDNGLTQRRQSSLTS